MEITEPDTGLSRYTSHLDISSDLEGFAVTLTQNTAIMQLDKWVMSECTFTKVYIFLLQNQIFITMCSFIVISYTPIGILVSMHV